MLVFQICFVHVTWKLRCLSHCCIVYCDLLTFLFLLFRSHIPEIRIFTPPDLHFGKVIIHFCALNKCSKGQSRETGNIRYTRRRKTKQKQSRETGNIGYTRRRKTKQKQSRETGNIRYTRRRKSTTQFILDTNKHK